MYYSKKEIMVEFQNEEYEDDEMDIYPPSICPYCGYVVKMESRGGFKSINTLITFECPHCNELSAALYNDSKYEPLRIFPSQKAKSNKIPEEILIISPKFENLYLQAISAEDNDLPELAALAYRRALEFLVKDFCIHLFPNDENAIKKEHLNFSIKRLEYISPLITNIANKIRIIGNDYTHYLSKLDYTAADMKKFIGILMPFIQGALLAEHPL